MEPNPVMEHESSGPPKCGAKSKTSASGTCGKPAGWGTDHPGVGRCRIHGGTSPSGNLFAAKQEMAVMGGPLDVEPHEALLACVRIAAGEVAYCNDRLSRLTQEEALENPKEETRRSVEGEGAGDTEMVEKKTHAVELNIWIRTRQGALDRLARFAKMALDAGVEERKVQIAESMGSELARLLQGILSDLELSDGQQKLVPSVVEKHLLTVEATGARHLSHD